jgi:hypothetical protein
MGMIVFVVGEVLKLVLVERLFRVNRHKLISIPAFAWTYGRYLQAKEWLESFEAWQTARRWRRLARYAVRSYVQEAKGSVGLEPSRSSLANATIPILTHPEEPCLLPNCRGKADLALRRQHYRF